MGEFEAEKSTPNFVDECAGLIEFKEPVVIAPVEDEDVPLGISGHRDGLAQVFAWREFQEVRHTGKRNFRDVLDGRLALRKRRRECYQRESDRREKQSFHGNLLYDCRPLSAIVCKGPGSGTPDLIAY